MQSFQKVGVSEADLVQLCRDLFEELVNRLALLRPVHKSVSLHAEFVIGAQELDIDVSFGTAEVEVLQFETSSHVVELGYTRDLDVVVERCKSFCVYDLFLLETEECDSKEDEDHEHD